MQDRQTRVLETFNAVMPKMNELEQEKLLSYGEGLAFLFRDRAVQPVPPSQETERPSA